MLNILWYRTRNRSDSLSSATMCKMTLLLNRDYYLKRSVHSYCFTAN